MVARIDASNAWTMGCRCGIWRRNQSSMSEWFADGSGGFRRAFPLISFGIAPPPPNERRRLMRQVVRPEDHASCGLPRIVETPRLGASRKPEIDPLSVREVVIRAERVVVVIPRSRCRSGRFRRGTAGSGFSDEVEATGRGSALGVQVSDRWARLGTGAARRVRLGAGC